MNLMSNKLIAIALIGMVMLLGSCGESVDPTTSNINLEMRATTQLSTMNANARVSNTGIEFTKVLIGVTEIELEALDEGHDDDDDHSSDNHSNDDSDNHSDDHNDDSGKHSDDEIEFEGQFVVDLLKGTSNPEFRITDIAPGVYKELEVKISPIMDDGNSIFIQFNYHADSTDSVIVEYTSNREIKFEIENHSGMQFNGNAINQILILFDLDKLFSGVDLSMAISDNDGVIRINSSSNTGLSNSLWQNLDNAFKAGEDHDGDHEIDDDSDDDHNDHDHDDDDD